MRSSATRLLFVCLVVAAAFSAAAQSSDPFALTAPLVSQAITSCGDVAMSNGLIDSSAITGRGNILSNGTIKVSGGKVDGDATAGPGSTVKLSGNGMITGASSSATTAFPCSIIDLAALSARLASTNDNASIPLTAQHKVAVQSNGDFKLSGGDSLTLQAGTYFFQKFTMSGGSTLTFAGPVRILTTSDVSVSGGSVAGASPWQLHFWSTATKFDLGSSTFAGFIYAPFAPVAISAEIISGGIYGGAVTVSGNSHITRTIDDTPPQLTITSPTDGQPLSDLSNVVVRGMVLDPETALTSFTVNGTAVTPANDGTFVVTISLGAVSPAKITAIATNAAGLTATSTISVQAAMTQILTVPTSLTIDQNATGQLRATATYADGTTSDVTSLATWTSSSTAIATVNGGVVTGVHPGTATITATLGPLTASSSVTVNAVLQSIAVSPQTVNVAVGAKQSFTATGTYSDGTTSDISTAVTWSSSDASIATIDAHGVATAVTPGAVTIHASLGAIAGSGSLTVFGAPTITSIQPTRGKTAGGDSITIVGTNFAIANTSISFGGTSASVTSLTSTTLTVSIPAHAVGVVDVVVTTPGGSATATGGFTFVAPPTVSAIAPARGKAAGGDTVVITGTNFDASGTSVTIGGTAALNVVVVSPTSLTAVTPPGAAGVADLVVTTAGGAATLPGAFTYVPAPVITSISPTQALAGSSVIIGGLNFDPTPANDLVTFAGIPAVVTSASAIQLTVTVPAGANSGLVQVTTAGGSAASSQSFTFITYQRLAFNATSVTLQLGQQQQLTATATLSDGSFVDVTASATWFVDDGSVASATGGLVTALAAGTTTVRGTFAGLNTTAAVTVTAPNPLPPDPTTIATAIDPTKPTIFSDSIAFLYGPNGTQRSVTPGAINTAHVNVMRGRVLDTTGAPISGVRVSALRSPQVGYALTRTDGTYDLVVNGGGWTVVAFEKDGLITAHRSVRTSWQDFTVVDDVRMTAYDSHATTIDLTQGASIARGSVVTDTDGTRQATLLFPAGDIATAVKPDGSTVPLSTLTVRATEQTVGKDGAMPADIAPGTAYTYCVEISADEAVAIGASTIQFSKPVALYVDDFLNFTVGSNVPSGFYDRANARWVPIASGRVVKILAISGGVAALDITGDGIADDASSIGITDVERGQLASLYPVGKTLWRVSLDHFTPIDPNWADGFPDDADYPDEAKAGIDPSVEKQSCQAGSIIECESDTLGKTIPIGGTPYTLEYRSRDAVAYTGDRTVDIRLTDATIPASLKRVELTLLVAGQRFKYALAPAPNLTQTFVWDGRDGYGRFNYLDKDLYVHIAYVYDGKYKVGGTFGGDAFALATSVSTRNEVRIGQDYTVRLSGPRATQGLGGWFINTVHSYDAGSHLLRLGTGEDINMEARGDTGQQEAFASGDAGLVLTGGDGSVYGWGSSMRRIARVDGSGLFSVIAGGFTATGPTTDGSPAVGALLQVRSFAPLPDGDYVFVNSDASGYRLMLIHNGLLKTLTSTAALHVNINSVTVSPDGTILIADDLRGISAVDKSGNVTSPYPEASFAVFGGNPNVDQAVYKEDGRLYVYLSTNPSGFFTLHKVLVLQGGVFKEMQSPCANHVFNFTARPDGSLLFNCACSNIFTTTPALKIVASDGTVSDYTSLPAPSTCNASFASLPNGQLAHSESTNTTTGVCAPQNSCVILGGAPIPFAATGGGYTVATPDASNAFKFGLDGRLQEARDALTNTLLYSASYTSSGLPSTITDANGLVTTIQRAPDGTPSAIVAPNGDTTALTIGTDGLISGITLPGNIRHAFTYDNGSLRHYTDPRGYETTYDYDTRGRLAAAHDAAGGSKTLTFTMSGNLSTVQLTTGGGQTSVYSVQSSAPGNASRTITSAGSTTTFNVTPASAAVTDADGTTASLTRSADPLWGASASYVSSANVTLPSGNTFTMTRTRIATASNSSDPLSLTGFTDTAVVNGSVYKLVYASSTRTLRLTSPLNRIVDRTFDTKGRLSTILLPGQTAISLGYDPRGHLTTITQGARVKTFTWSAQDRLSAVADSTGASGGFSYDASLHPVTQLLSGNRSVVLGYDENGNVTSFTPPGGQPNVFAYNPVNYATSWSQPSGAVTSYQIDIDRRLRLVTRPNGAPIGFTYSSGRLSTVTSPSGTRQYAYDAGGSLRSISASDGPTVTYTHDGMLPTGQSWSGGGISGSVGMTFNSNFLPAAESVNGTSVSFGYDDDGLLLSAGALAIARVAATGLPATATIGTLSDSYAFNNFGEIASDTFKAGSSTIFGLSYVRDGGGRISSVTENSGTQSVTTSYGYDPAGRLADVSVAGALVRHYEYDTNGNRVSKTDANGTVTASIDSQDHLQSYGDASYSYSANGELQSKVDSTGTTSYSYDASGILRRVDLPNGNVVEYVIDGQNRRVGKKVNGTLVQGWLYADQLRIVAETDGAGNVTKRFVYGLRTNVPDYMTWSGSTYRFVTDHLGSPRYLLETSGGTVAQAVTYDEYGLVLSDSNSSFQPFRFAGGLYDPDTRLAHFGAREYDPQTGRWLSGDPGLFTGGTNLYGYAFGDPVNYIDRDGRIPLPVVTALIGAGAGFVGSVAGQLIANHGTDCFSWKDAFIAAGVGAVAGAAAPFTAASYLGAMVTGAVANTVQTAATDYAHGRDSTAGGLAGAAATGMLGGVVAGPVSTAGAGFNESTLWGDRDLFRQVNQTENARQAVGGIGRSAGSALTTDTPQNGKCGCQ